MTETKTSDHVAVFRGPQSTSSSPLLFSFACPFGRNVFCPTDRLILLSVVLPNTPRLQQAQRHGSHARNGERRNSSRDEASRVKRKDREQRDGIKGWVLSHPPRSETTRRSDLPFCPHGRLSRRIRSLPSHHSPTSPAPPATWKQPPSSSSTATTTRAPSSSTIRPPSRP